MTESSWIVDQLVQQGVRHFCIAPGSRSTPLVMAARAHQGAKIHVHYDERGLGFYAQRPLNVNHEILLKVGFVGFSDERPSEVAPAIVRWVKPIGDAYAVGVEFKNLNKKEHFVLLGYLEHAEKISHDILKGALP